MATRYDYLRIAKAMLDDWQNDTCEGKYLKSFYERKVKKIKITVINKKPIVTLNHMVVFFI